MARARISREVVADELRRFVLTWREGEVWEVSEDVGGNIMHQFQGVLGPKYGERGVWEMQVQSNLFLTEEER